MDSDVEERLQRLEKENVKLKERVRKLEENDRKLAQDQQEIWKTA